MKKNRISAVFTRGLGLLTAAVLLLPGLSAAALYDLPENTTVSGKGILVASLGSNQSEDVILFEREADVRIAPSALLRVMTTVVALEIADEKKLDIDKETGTYTSDLFYTFVGGTGLITAGMELGEEWTIRDLINMTMIQTAADAAVTMADALAGSQTAFVERMNQKAEELGCENTHFANVMGLDDPNQYVSARDMYKITRYAMDNPKFLSIAKQTSYTAKPLNKRGEVTFPNSNGMMRSNSGDSYYKPMVFGRTGVSDTGRNIVSVASDSGYEYMVVILDSPLKDDQGKAIYPYIDDTKTLYRWAFNNFEYSTILNKNEPVDSLKVNLAWDTDKVSLVPKEDFSTIVSVNLSPSAIRKEVTKYKDTVDAPVEKGTVYGKVELFINVDEKIGEVELVAAEQVEASEVLVLWENVRSFLTSPWFIGGLAVLTVLLIGYIILNVVHNRRRKRRKMKRVKKYK